MERVIKGVYDNVLNGTHVVSEKRAEVFAESMKELILNVFTGKDREPRLSPSNFGSKCERKLWYLMNTPDELEKLDPQTRFKFMYGHMVEELLLFLVEEAGFSVESKQGEVNVCGVKGNKDAVIEGQLVDVKSASAYGMMKFRNHKLQTDDPFAYLDQLNIYLKGSQDDPNLKVKDKASFLVADKVSGEIVEDQYEFDVEDDEAYAKSISDKRDMLANEEPPKRGVLPEPDGRSGNLILPVTCRYCSAKHKCYPELRTFAYSNGPKYYTHVEKEPRVQEITDDIK